MQALGVLETRTEENTFQTREARPALPRTEDAPIEYEPHRSKVPRDVDALVRLMELNLFTAIDESRQRVAKLPSATNLAQLAQALAAGGVSDEARDVASDCLIASKSAGDGEAFDSWAVRICLEVLLRLGHLDEARHHARHLPVDESALLMMGTLLAERGFFAEARELIEPVDAEEKDAVLAFILISEGQYQPAVPLLRAALRRTSNDADSAYNLSIAFVHLGATRKALAAAQRATRVAPGRQDLSLHYLDLLMHSGRFDSVLEEVQRLFDSGVRATARLVTFQARARLGFGDFGKAEPLLVRALGLSKTEKDADTAAEVQSNLTRLRVQYKNANREAAIQDLARQSFENPASEVVVGNLARLAVRRHHASILRSAYSRLEIDVSDEGAAFIDFQLATLEGRNLDAAVAAERWYEIEPESPFACSAAMTALGIGAERWGDAAVIASKVVQAGMTASSDGLLNNAAYIMAMSGKSEQAIRLLEARGAQKDPVLRATLGLAYISSNRVDRGMKLYREAAVAADTEANGNGEVRSLMTVHQALIVRQLGLLDTGDVTRILATALPAVDLPDFWMDRPEFLRIEHVARRHGYPWPLTL
jgi:tetratricopeptide (TPR) repeat protein